MQFICKFERPHQRHHEKLLWNFCLVLGLQLLDYPFIFVKLLLECDQNFLHFFIFFKLIWVFHFYTGVNLFLIFNGRLWSIHQIVPGIFEIRKDTRRTYGLFSNIIFPEDPPTKEGVKTFMKISNAVGAEKYFDAKELTAFFADILWFF